MALSIINSHHVKKLIGILKSVAGAYGYNFLFLLIKSWGYFQLTTEIGF